MDTHISRCRHDGALQATRGLRGGSQVGEESESEHRQDRRRRRLRGRRVLYARFLIFKPPTPLNHLCYLSFILFVPSGSWCASASRVCECRRRCQVKYAVHSRMAPMNKQQQCHHETFTKKKERSWGRGGMTGQKMRQKETRRG